MNQEDIHKMVREAGASGLKPVIARKETDPITAYRFTEEALVRLAALVAAKAAQDERESIASHYARQPHVEFFGAELADEIRARGQ